MYIQKIAFTLAFGLTAISASAFGAAQCEAGLVSKNQESPCASFEIPDNGSGQTSFNCTGFAITVDCDLHVKPNRLSLTITSPHRIPSASTCSQRELSLVDANGNGAFVRCTFQ